MWNGTKQLFCKFFIEHVTMTLWKERTTRKKRIKELYVHFDSSLSQPQKASLISFDPLIFSQVFGLMTKPLVRLLLPLPKHCLSTISSDPSTPKSFVVPLLSNGHDSDTNKVSQPVCPTSLRMLFSTPTHTVHHYWRKFDDAFMRPVFGGRGFVPFVPGSPVEQSIHPWQW